MNVWVAFATLCFSTMVAVQGLNAGLKLRIAVAIAQWSAVWLLVLRLAAFAVGQTTA
jgi:hypothetical protein